MTKWTDEELDEFHSMLYAFLSFINEPELQKISEKESDQYYQKVVFGHISSLKTRINEMLEEHGGRCYPITKLNKGNEK